MLNKKDINKFITPEIKNKYKLEYKRLAMFLAQCDHESMGFTRVRENLNYSKEALLKLVDRNGDNYFTEEDAECYGRTQHHPANQEMIANIFYSSKYDGYGNIIRDRMGNGDVKSGDGWFYRGGGYIQLTGKRMYELCGIALKLDLLNNPALICQPQNAMGTSLWYWDVNNCNDVADDIKKVTKIINGGYNGLDKREALYENYLKILVA